MHPPVREYIRRGEREIKNPDGWVKREAGASPRADIPTPSRCQGTIAPGTILVTLKRVKERLVCCFKKSGVGGGGEHITGASKRALRFC